MEFLTELGLLGMFLSAFLAATILPLSSEIVLSTLLLNDFPAASLLLVASVGNILGSVVNYWLGYFGADYIRQHWLRMSDVAFAKTTQRYQKWGMWSLLLAWVPIIGDPLTLVAGALKVRFIWFLVLVSVGKIGRYAVIIYVLQ